MQRCFFAISNVRHCALRRVCSVGTHLPASRRPLNASSHRAVLLSMEDYPCDVIRNFSIIAHVDHGKTTLSDRLLEMTNTISKRSAKSDQQYLDKLQVERERGITVKAQTVTLRYQLPNPNLDRRTFLLNFIDTPGHVDFAWEVSRSLAACQGAVLLIDASQGIQAQTISVYNGAKSRGLKIIPVLNKIDLPAADSARVTAQLVNTFGINSDEVLHISAKSGKGVEDVLQAIVHRIPPPPARIENKLRAFLFDSYFDRFRGVVTLLSIQDGTIRKGDKIASSHSRKKYEVLDVGVLHPEETPTGYLQAGQVGYIACNMKDSSEAHIGDTFHRVGEAVEPLVGFQPSKPMVFAGFFPFDSSEFPRLEESIKRLTLTDRSVSVQREFSTALGQGCRLGFLGTLHMDVFRQRLEDEYDAKVLITAPSVTYKVTKRGESRYISNPVDFPEYGPDFRTTIIEEPFVRITIVVPGEYLGAMIQLCSDHRGEELDQSYLEGESLTSRVTLSAVLPLSEVVQDFFDKLKGLSSGYASFDYEDIGYRPSAVSKMSFLLNQAPVDALVTIVHKSSQERLAREWVRKLKEVIPRQLFEIPIQAMVNGKVIARETISAARKDVTAGLYGGHYERKLKHLNKQKEGKSRLKRVGKVDLPQEAFYDLLSSRK